MPMTPESPSEGDGRTCLSGLSQWARRLGREQRCAVRKRATPHDIERAWELALAVAQSRPGLSRDPQSLPEAPCYYRCPASGRAAVHNPGSHTSTSATVAAPGGQAPNPRRRGMPAGLTSVTWVSRMSVLNDCEIAKPRPSITTAMKVIARTGLNLEQMPPSSVAGPTSWLHERNSGWPTTSANSHLPKCIGSCPAASACDLTRHARRRHKRAGSRLHNDAQNVRGRACCAR